MLDFTHVNLSHAEFSQTNDQVLQSVDYWPENLDPLICKKSQKTAKAPKVH